MKVWITKYALTTGIWVVDADMSERNAGMIFWRPKGGGLLQFAHGKDWWLTEADAIDRAEEMRQAKTAAPKPPSRPKVDFVVSNAVVLINGLSEADIKCCDDPDIEWVTIKADALGDLITAVREMQQAGKTLDADKQQELAV